MDIFRKNKNDPVGKQEEQMTYYIYIDQDILKEAKTRLKNVTMIWIDSKKVYDIIPQTL